MRKDFLREALRPRIMKVNADLRSQVSKFGTLKICKVQKGNNEKHYITYDL